MLKERWAANIRLAAVVVDVLIQLRAILLRSPAQMP
jgi:hypothetical protein